MNVASLTSKVFIQLVPYCNLKAVHSTDITSHLRILPSAAYNVRDVSTAMSYNAPQTDDARMMKCVSTETGMRSIYTPSPEDDATENTFQQW